MLSRRWILSAAVVAAFAYAATPYVTLWQLTQAICDGDSHALEALVDWNSVRQGLKDDIAEGIVGAPSTDGTAQLASNTLPPFGASFISGIAGSFVDREVTPERLVATMRVLAPAEITPVESLLGTLHGLEYAFFDGPRSFVLRLRCPGQEADEQPLRLRMALRHDGWRVVRAWVPQDLIDRADSRT